MKVGISFILLLFAIESSIAFSQSGKSDSAFVSLITVFPGDVPEQLFGHSALRVVDPRRGIDLVYNYGTFQFGGLFVFEFLTGKLDYYLGVESFPRSFKQYQFDNRTVIEQRLNLTPAERESLFTALRINAQRENRYYRYKFLEDNCTTRVPSVLAKVVRGNLYYSFVPDSGMTFRQSLQPYFEGHSFLGLGANTLLGSPVDLEMRNNEPLFLPINMLQAFDNATIIHSNATRPLVAEKDTLFWSSDVQLKTSGPWTSIVAWALFLFGGYVTIQNYKTNANSGYFDLLLFGLVGLLGLLIVFLWIASNHQVTKPNWSLLWAWPTHILAAILLFKASNHDILKIYFAASSLACVAVLIAWFSLPQQIDIALFPVVLLLAIRALAITRIIKAS